MSDIDAEDISRRIKTLLDELSSLKVHSVVLATFPSRHGKVVFGMEMNTTHEIAHSLLEAGRKRVDDTSAVDTVPGTPGS